MDMKGDIMVKEMDDEDAKRFDAELRASEDTLSFYQSYLEESACEYVAAYCKGEVAGFAKLDWQSTYEDFAEQQIPEIKDLWVFEAYRGQGVASAMMQYLEKRAAKDSEICAVGVGLAEEFEAAQSLFQKLGYEPDGKGTFYIESNTVQDELEVDDTQALMMVKKI